MPIVVVGTEKNFAALRKRLFEGQVSPKVAAEVADQVQAANPHADLDKLTPGTVLTIPAGANVPLRDELSLDDATTSELRSLGELAKTQLAAIVTAADERESATREDHGAALKALDSVSAAAKKREPGLAKDLTAARKAIEADDADAQQHMEQLKQAQAEWSDGLDTLLQRLG
jgi:hypothetical protein